MVFKNTFSCLLQTKKHLEHGVHPGVYVSPCLYPLFSLTVLYGMHRTNGTVNHKGKDVAQHMGSIYITSDREQLLLSKVTDTKKKQPYLLTNI